MNSAARDIISGNNNLIERAHVGGDKIDAHVAAATASRRARRHRGAYINLSAAHHRGSAASVLWRVRAQRR